MAPTALRIYPPLLLPAQQKARFLSSAPSSRGCSPGSRRQPVCSSDPHHHQQGPTNDDAQLRAEISPSVLRALQPQDTSSSPNSSGESLIERNLRKRAKSQQSSSSVSLVETSASSTFLGTGESSDLSSLPEKLGSSTSGQAETQYSPPSTTSGQALPLSEKSSFPAHGSGERFQGYGMSAPYPITAAFWQEMPPGFDMEDFHNIDFYVWYFRFSLVLNILIAEDPEYVRSVSLSSLLWLLLPSNGFSSYFLERRDYWFPGWKKDDVNQLRKVLDNKDALSGAIETFSALWSSDAWTKRAASGKASELVLALAYSAYVYLLSGADDAATISKKKLEEYSQALNQALTKLHGQILDPLEIWEKALKGTSFSLNGTAFVYDYALIFPCKIESTERRIEFGPMMEEIQTRLDKELKASDLAVLLRRSSDKQEEFFILVAPWYWILTVDSKQLAPIPVILSVLSCLATSHFTGAGFDFGFSWEQYAAPLGWAGILASIYFTSGRRFPTICPFPSLGAIGKFSSDYGVVSSRSSLVTAILKKSCVPLAVSFLLLGLGFTFWGPSLYNLASVVDFRGYILVPPDLFSYSGILTKLLQSASVASIQAEEDGGSMLAASPFVVAGLLGVNFTAFSLLPGIHTDGGSLLRSLLKSKKLANQLNQAFTVLLTVYLFAKNPSLGLGWVAVTCMSSRESIVKDDVSDTDVVPSLAASMLVLAALTCFIPFLQ